MEELSVSYKQGCLRSRYDIADNDTIVEHTPTQA